MVKNEQIDVSTVLVLIRLTQVEAFQSRWQYS